MPGTSPGHNDAGVMRMKPKRAKRPPVTPGEQERPVPQDVYPVLDTDLARDNLENDLTPADLQSL